MGNLAPTLGCYGQYITGKNVDVIIQCLINKLTMN